MRSTPEAKRDFVFGCDLAGRTLAYRSKRLRSSTLIDEKPPPTGVVSGLFRATRLRRIESMVAAGSSSPVFSRATRPASANSYASPTSIASSTCRAASMISGPMPSPRMTVIVWVICRFRTGARRRRGRRARGESAGNYARRPGTEPSAVVVRARPGRLSRLEAIEEVDGPAQVRDHDRSADHQPDRKRFEHFVAVQPRILALGHVVADAVVAAQHQGGDQAEQFLGLHVQRAGLVGLGVQGEEPAHDLVGLGQDAFVHALAEGGELRDPAVAGTPVAGTLAGAHWPASSKASSFPARCRAIRSS